MDGCILVVNGDDGGADHRGDQDLLYLTALGVVTAVSVLANGPSSKDFVHSARGQKVSLGLHFNLSEGTPVGGPYKTLTNNEGLFFSNKHTVWEKAAEGHFDPDEVAAEAVAQFGALESMGADIDHIDGHNHIQIFQNVFEGLHRALSDKSLYFRVPEEPECPENCMPGMPTPSLDGETIREKASRNWRFADRFAGYAFSAKPFYEGIAHLADPVPGVTELMVHPNWRPGSVFTMDNKRYLERDYIASKGFFESAMNWGYQFGGFQ